jgi:hypothetical protein
MDKITGTHILCVHDHEQLDTTFNPAYHSNYDLPIIKIGGTTSKYPPAPKFWVGVNDIALFGPPILSPFMLTYTKVIQFVYP